jgi:hypothetical protein
MPITLGCPSCGKRFRARDESAGKKVKCPYCQAAVPVPSEGASDVAEPTGAVPTPQDRDQLPPTLPPRVSGNISRPVIPPAPPVVAKPDDWGAIPSGPALSPPTPPATPPRIPEPEPPQFPADAPVLGFEKTSSSPNTRDKKPRPKPLVTEPAKKPDQTPDEVLAERWESVRRGLFWVQFALFWFSLIGFVGFGKAVYTRAVGELPKGQGWVKIEGYINSAGPNSLQTTKMMEIHILAYGLPLLFGGITLTLGRLMSSGGPRNSGSRGLIAWSGIFTMVSFLAVIVVIGSTAFEFRDELRYGTLALICAFPLSEFLFLCGLVACGIALKRPRVARTVGVLGFFVALIPLLTSNELWVQYVGHVRPKQPDDDWRMYEQAAIMMGWLILIVTYSRTVRGVRVAAREFIDGVAIKNS